MEKIECKYCKGKGVSKNGYARKKQRYKCKSCNKNFTEGDGRKNWKYGNKERSMVIKMYLNNCGIRRIAHILNIPLSTVFYWIKQAGKVVDEMVTNQKIEGDKKRIEILEMDELYTYVKKKRIKQEYGLLSIGTDSKLLRLK
ncbi:IS1/IS1595 family N-terminal zinc-binding domain-containing protein [Candidatus Bandiella euplotis]|uniref:IS1 family transposase n=2 Tax=Candidatus Bandiella euplotis TaxID=1664265 RepID=A0ABZ0UPG4_9RICK|nr:hypothetical protein [Candidatus Bandiella woodruffii]WPX96192.1 IS1 family transposase [Candidatus Bandiella woodruffii]WPX96273.1 IS1 family transposase [Candidatus Bandiella woodruffii]WPX96347.1 IS1 family transposase [Candidatus Bandiella woodruffii]WPX96740.1 IS1 family transposase [Candidatus Bandiella woodruffii]WPX96788.1 IS1 family transposase [Candidatus Bandiella woodruffii]